MLHDFPFNSFFWVIVVFMFDVMIFIDINVVFLFVDGFMLFF